MLEGLDSEIKNDEEREKWRLFGIKNIVTNNMRFLAIELC